MNPDEVGQNPHEISEDCLLQLIRRVYKTIQNQHKRVMMLLTLDILYCFFQVYLQSNLKSTNCTDGMKIHVYLSYLILWLDSMNLAVFIQGEYNIGGIRN